MLLECFRGGFAVLGLPVTLRVLSVWGIYGFVVLGGFVITLLGGLEWLRVLGGFVRLWGFSLDVGGLG